jgi:hypothetical protein
VISQNREATLREGGELAGHDNPDDVAIWEAIASQAVPLIDKLWDAIAKGIPEDTTLRGFQNRHEDIPRLQLVMIDRADNKWIQAVYDICAKEWGKSGKPKPPNLDRVIWTFAINPFIDQRLEELLKRACGVVFPGSA